MPFDAGFAAAVIKELNQTILGARIEKIHQPEREEVILCLRGAAGNARLLFSCAPGSARVGLTSVEKENPKNPPMFCMLLRKHLSGGHVLSADQLGFDRVLRFKICSRDEMGFAVNKYIIVEIMGKYGNIILLDADMRVIFPLRAVDLATFSKRQVLPGFSYEPPPAQSGKIEARPLTKESFLSILDGAAEADRRVSCDKFLLSRFSGLSPLTAREIAFRTAKDTAAPLSLCDPDALWTRFHSMYGETDEIRDSPCLLRGADGNFFDFCFTEISQYENAATIVRPESFSALLDLFYARRQSKERIGQRARDITKLLSSACARVNRKIELQQGELALCADKGKYKKWGDLITAHMYLLKKGMTRARLTDYADPGAPDAEVPLDPTLTPAQNAQRYYKKYNKAKTAEIMLTKQLEQSRRELLYLDSVRESLTYAETERDFNEIRAELSQGGYYRKPSLPSGKGKRPNGSRPARGKGSLTPMTFKTSGGWRVLCGRNNLQNDHIVLSLAGKNDYWFHVKNLPGSHAVLLCADSEPDARDFTECAMIAAFYSGGRNTPHVAVDYTRVKNLRKPQGAKPGYFIYDTNFTAFVTADETAVLNMKTD